MKSIDFPGAFLKIGAGQDEYHTIHAMPLEDSREGEVIAIYELTDEEVEQIVKNKKLFYSRLTFFNQSTCQNCGKVTKVGFQPMRISAVPIKVNVNLVYENGEAVNVEGEVGPDGVTIPGYTKNAEGKFLKE